MSDEPTSHWNHRVVRFIDTDNEAKLTMAEVHYKDDKPYGWSDPFFSSETLDGLIELCERFALALGKPILNAEKDFPSTKIEVTELREYFLALGHPRDE